VTTAETAATGCYVYGVVSVDDAARALERASTSVDGVMLVTEGKLAAIVSPVSLDEFGEAELPERLEDVSWLEPRVRAHEEVLERALDATAVVPFRFCTVYRRDEHVRRFLSEHECELVDALDHVRDRVELGVKAFADREQLERKLGGSLPAARELEEQLAGAAGGRAYLIRRQLERALADEVERFRSGCARDSHARLSASAVDTRLSELHPAELTGERGEMLLNGVYLVGRGDPAFETALGELASSYRDFGVSFELTGPWPPYNFVPRELGPP
jgi:hypothetical protein